MSQQQQQIRSPTYLFTIGYNFSKSEKNFSLNPLTNVILLSATSNTLYLLTENQEIYSLHNYENNQEIKKLEVSKEYANDHTPVKFMSTGYYFLVIVKESNTIYGCGRNTFHQLLDFTEETTTLQTLLKPTNPFNNTLQNSLQNSLQNNLKDEYNPTLQNYLTSDLLEYNKITHLTCAGYGTIIILNESEIFNVGYYGSYEYSSDQFINLTPKMEKGQIIEKVTGGYFHFIVKYKNGNYYGFGDNGEGESNVGSNLQSCKVLTQIIFPFLKPNERVIDGFALPISSMSCFITSNNDIYFCGYLRTKSNLLINVMNNNFKDDSCHSGTKCHLLNYEKLINNEKLNYERNEFQVFGAYASIFFLDKRNETFYGDVEQFLDEPYLNLSKKVKEVDDNLLIVNRKVLSICCSNSSWGVLYGQIYSNNYMIMNLKKMSVGDILFLSDLDFVM